MNTRLLTAVMVAALTGAGAAFADQPPPAGGFLPPPEPVHREVSPLPHFLWGDEDDHAVPKFWVDVDYVLYWMSPARYPQPFLTTSPVPSLGILGQPDTRTVIGGDVDYGTINGFRFYSGGWWNRDRTIGSDGESIYLEQRGKGFASSSDGSVLLARPLINALNNSPAASLVAFPGFAAGNLVVETRSRFTTSDGNLMFNLLRDECTTINALVGYRYIYFREELRVIQNQQFLADDFGVFLGAPLPAGTTMTIRDRFETVNNMYLGQLGLSGETMRGRVVLGGHAKVGLGWANQRTFADGRTTVGDVTVPGGILGQTTIPYRNYNDEFVVASQFGAYVGMQLGQRWRIRAGYNMFYISNVARPGQQIDPAINPNQVPSFPQFGAAGGPARPTWPRNVTDMFVHGVNFGITYRY